MTTELRTEIEQRLASVQIRYDQKWTEYQAAKAAEESAPPPAHARLQGEWCELNSERMALLLLLRDSQPEGVVA